MEQCCSPIPTPHAGFLPISAKSFFLFSKKPSVSGQGTLALVTWWRAITPAFDAVLGRIGGEIGEGRDACSHDRQLGDRWRGGGCWIGKVEEEEAVMSGSLA